MTASTPVSRPVARVRRNSPRRVGPAPGTHGPGGGCAGMSWRHTLVMTKGVSAPALFALVLADLEEIGAGLEKRGALAGLGGRLLLLGLQVDQVGLAVDAATVLRWKSRYSCSSGSSTLEEVVAEFFPAGAGEPVRTARCAEGVLAAIAIEDDLLQGLAQPIRVAQGLLDLGRLGVAQGVVEVRMQLFAEMPASTLGGWTR